MLITIDWSSILSYIGGLGVVGGVIWAGIKHLAKSKVDLYFNKELENHKTDLLNITELNKFELQRKLNDFNLYAPKKHSIYPELYGLYLTADSLIKRFSGFRQMPNYIGYSSSELELSLTNRGVPKIRIDAFVDGWDTYKDSIVTELNEYMQFFEMNETKNAFVEARDKYSFSRLFLSDDVSSICVELNTTLWHYIVDIETLNNKEYPVEDRPPVRESKKSNEEKLNRLLDDIRRKMQEEMAVGYYEKSNL